MTLEDLDIDLAFMRHRMLFANSLEWIESYGQWLSIVNNGTRRNVLPIINSRK